MQLFEEYEDVRIKTLLLAGLPCQAQPTTPSPPLSNGGAEQDVKVEIKMDAGGTSISPQADHSAGMISGMHAIGHATSMGHATDAAYLARLSHKTS